MSTPKTKSKNGSTPKRKSNSKNTYSPVCIPRSPAQSQGNLTETPRLISDISADIYNDIQKWKDSILAGAPIIKEIGILKKEAILSKTNKFSEEMEPLCLAMLEIVDSLNTALNTLKSSNRKFEALNTLHKSTAVFFMQWPISKFLEIVTEIVEAFDLEMKLKRIATENIAHSKTESEIMFHTCSWVYEVYVNSSVYLALEALLTETGHRSF